MSRRKEIIATHRADTHNDPQYIRCEGCNKTWNGPDAWTDYGRHIDKLLTKTPKTPKEAITNALADHLGNPNDDSAWDWYLDVTLNEHGHIVCGCGWESTKPDDIDEWRNHMADAITNELEKTPKEETEPRKRVVEHPGHFNVEEVGTVETVDGSDWTAIIVLHTTEHHMDGKEYYIADDNGCSCFTPFEYFYSLDDFTGPMTRSQCLEELQNLLNQLYGKEDTQAQQDYKTLCKKLEG